MDDPAANRSSFHLRTQRNEVDTWTLQLREDPDPPWDEVRGALALEGADPTRTAAAFFYSEDVDEYTLVSLSDDGSAFEFLIRVHPEVDPPRRSLHLDGYQRLTEGSDPLVSGYLYSAACRLKDEGSEIDSIRYLEQHAESLTQLMRSDPDRTWRGLARSLEAVGIEPSRAILFQIVEHDRDSLGRGRSTIALIEHGGRIEECTGRTEGLHSIPMVIDDRSEISRVDAAKKYGPFLEAAIRLVSRTD